MKLLAPLLISASFAVPTWAGPCLETPLEASCVSIPGTTSCSVKQTSGTVQDCSNTVNMQPICHNDAPALRFTPPSEYTLSECSLESDILTKMRQGRLSGEIVCWNKGTCNLTGPTCSGLFSTGTRYYYSFSVDGLSCGHTTTPPVTTSSTTSTNIKIVFVAFVLATLFGI